jgi:hypothetical protein
MGRVLADLVLDRCERDLSAFSPARF